MRRRGVQGRPRRQLGGVQRWLGGAGKKRRTTGLGAGIKQGKEGGKQTGRRTGAAAGKGKQMTDAEMKRGRVTGGAEQRGKRQRGNAGAQKGAPREGIGKAMHTATLLQQRAWVGRCGREQGTEGGVASPTAALLQQLASSGAGGWAEQGVYT